MILRGIYYNNPFVYHLITWIKLGLSYNDRFVIASKFIFPKDRVLEICGADGEFSKHLPGNCTYACVECGPAFLSRLRERRIEFFNINLHEGLGQVDLKADVIVMINSLYQFRKTSVHDLLEEYKRIAKRAVVVEDVLGNMWGDDSLMQRLVNYLHKTAYHTQGKLFTNGEFETMMREHAYKCDMVNGRYAVGHYGY